jgi:hypothetical protein
MRVRHGPRVLAVNSFSSTGHWKVTAGHASFFDLCAHYISCRAQQRSGAALGRPNHARPLASVEQATPLLVGQAGFIHKLGRGAEIQPGSSFRISNPFSISRLFQIYFKL